MLSTDTGQSTETLDVALYVVVADQGRGCEMSSTGTARGVSRGEGSEEASAQSPHGRDKSCVLACLRMRQPLVLLYGYKE